MGREEPNDAQAMRSRTRAALPGPAAAALALLVDGACVFAFAASGRSQHGEAATLGGLWETAWPFLFALVFTWAISATWRRPFAVWRSGLAVWLGTLVFGMVMRVAFTDGGAPVPFVLVATGALGAAFLGWRGILALVRRRTSQAA